MEIIEINSKEILNNFIVHDSDDNFLQSWEWGEFQKSLGKKIWRCAIEHSGGLIASALVIKNNLPLGRSYLYCPRGPVFRNQESGIMKQEWELVLGQVKKISQAEKAIFWRFDWPDSCLPQFLRIDKKLIKAPQDIQPQSTLILNLHQSEEEVLAQMKAKTRYNIRLAKRKGVIARQSVTQKDLASFLKLLQITSKRDGFKLHPSHYYYKMLEFFGPLGALKIFLAEFERKILAANLVFFWGERATYLHGASSNLYRNLMAPHLLQWQQILEAKKQGCTEYDFWGIRSESGMQSKSEGGIDATKNQDSWGGITRFKKGFGGREVSYAGTYDIIINPFWYKIYRLFKR